MWVRNLEKTKIQFVTWQRKIREEWIKHSTYLTKNCFIEKLDGRNVIMYIRTFVCVFEHFVFETIKKFDMQKLQRRACIKNWSERVGTYLVICIWNSIYFLQDKNFFKDVISKLYVCLIFLNIKILFMNIRL